MRKLVRSQTVARLKKLNREVRQVAHKPADADAIHDLRVSIRRLRQELNVFEAWFKPGPLKRIRGNLKKLMERCGAVRNCDIAVEVLRAARWRRRELSEGLENERQHTGKELAHTIAGWLQRGKIHSWRQHLRIIQPQAKGDRGGSVAEHAKRLLPPLIEDFFRAGREAARPGSTHHRMHRLRLEAKRVRYTLELFEPVYGENAKQILEPLKKLQDQLGAINDCAATLEMVRRNKDAAAAVQGLADKREAAFREYWGKHFGSAKRAEWKAVLSAADGKK
jgi:CHAD domain-containing protein